MNLRILNLVCDEKFIDNQIAFYAEAFPSLAKNDFVCATKANQLKTITSKKVSIIHPSNILQFIKANDYNIIFLHSLYALPISLIPELPGSIKVFWCSWGYDIYYAKVGDPLVKIDLYGNISKKLIRKAIPLKHHLKDFAKKILCHNKLKQKRKIFEQAVHRIDFYSGIIPEEYNRIKLQNSFFRAAPFEYGYNRPAKDSYIREERRNDPAQVGENILIGNSADLSNNHIEAMFALKKQINSEKRKIILPLSYPPNIDVRPILDLGKKLFGNAFTPLTGFLPFSQYFEIINSCGYVIMYHERQQALGNITMSLWTGCKIFLSKTSLLYSFLKGKGFIIYSVQDDLHPSAFTPLQYENIIYNRDLLLKHFSCNAAKIQMHKLYETMLKASQKKQANQSNAACQNSPPKQPNQSLRTNNKNSYSHFPEKPKSLH